MPHKIAQMCAFVCFQKIVESTSVLVQANGSVISNGQAFKVLFTVSQLEFLFNLRASYYFVSFSMLGIILIIRNFVLGNEF